MIYLVNGSPLKAETLLKANVNFADKVVILGNDSSIKTVEKHEMLDAEVIYIYKAVRRCNKDVQILTELVSNDNIDFLLPDGQTCTEFVHSTLYAAGEVYQSAIIDTLTCASYFNEHLVTVM